MQIVHWYQSWGAADVNASAFDLSFLTTTLIRGSTPYAQKPYALKTPNTRRIISTRKNAPSPTPCRYSLRMVRARKKLLSSIRSAIGGAAPKAYRC